MTPTELILPVVTLKPREDRRLRHGHLWVFSNEIAAVEGSPAAGDLVRVAAAHGRDLGYGIYNPHSLIALRLTSRADQAEEGSAVDADWFRRRLARATALRARLFPGESTYRLLHSESDGVPGVIVDRYGAVCVVQTAALGMELRRDLLYDALMELEGVEGVVERNDHGLRTMEGLPVRVGLVRGTADPQIVSDGVLRYHVDPLGGQKTGLYLDQRENRIAMRAFAPASRVLDLFSNSGGFALHAAHAGAASVVAVDSSAPAIAEIEANRVLNGIGAIETVTGDVFAQLDAMRIRGDRFDVVIADPPPFARSRKHVTAARKKYVDLFARTLSVLAPDGFVFWATCSHHITRDTFTEMTREALVRAERSGMVLAERGAAMDHPVHPAMPETAYLHAAILRVA